MGPYVRAYSILINAWSKSRMADAPIEAKKVLVKLSNMYSNGFIEEGPNTITYTSVINTYAAHGDVEGASDMLGMMEKDFEAGNNDARPNIRTYSTIINAWSKSGHDNAPHEAKNMLNKIIYL